MAPATVSGMTLQAFVRDVVETNPEVREQVHVYRQVAQDEDIARSGWRPRVDLGASFGQFSRTAPNTNQARRDFGSQQGDLTVSQNLFQGFDTTHAIDQARARVSAAAFQLYDVADNVALRAVQAYLRAITEKRLVSLAAQNVASHQLILSQLRELSERGITRRSDLEQTEGRLARAQASLIAEQNNLEDTLTQLHTLLGRYLSPDHLVEPGMPDPVREDTLQVLIDEALRAHPGIESARMNVEAANFDYKRSRSSDLPSLDLALRGTVGDDIDGSLGRTEEGSAVLSLSYNLYRGGADRANQRKKVSAIHENKSFLDKVRRQVIDTLRLAWSADRALQSQLPYLDRHARKSLETVELYRDEYLLQKRDLIDLLDAESELNSALSNQSEAVYDAVAARYRVYEGLGALFGAMSMSVEIDGRDLRIASLTAAGLDDPELAADRDADGIPDAIDQCDNTPAGTSPGGAGCGDIPTVILGMAGVDLTFMAVDDSFEVAAGSEVSFTIAELLANDEMKARDRPELRAFTQAERGVVTSDGEHTLIYTPAEGFTGEDQFEYTVGDQRGRLSAALVHVQVTPPPASDLETVYFGYKSDALTERSLTRLDAIVTRLTREPAADIDIVAYTDNVGSAGYNQRLSERRAAWVRGELVRRGIDAARIRARGEGENDPVTSNRTEAGRALNRRVELRFVPGASR